VFRCKPCRYLLDADGARRIGLERVVGWSDLIAQPVVHGSIAGHQHALQRLLGSSSLDLPWELAQDQSLALNLPTGIVDVDTDQFPRLT
jgi:hypothetical protein